MRNLKEEHFIRRIDRDTDNSDIRFFQGQQATDPEDFHGMYQCVTE